MRSADDSIPAWGAAVLGAWAVAATGIGRSLTAWRPARFDSALFAYIGSQWLSGRRPYADVWDNKPPGIFAIDALVFRVCGMSFAALALVEGVFVLASILFVYLFVRRCGAGWRAASVAAAACASASNLLYFNSSGNLTEIYLLAPAAASMYCFARSGPDFRGRWIFLAGLCSGLAALFKPPGLSPLAAQSVFLVVTFALRRRPTALGVLRSSLTNLLGVGAAWLPAIVYFASRGMLAAFLDASLLYNIRYGGSSYRYVSRMILAPLTHLVFMAPLVVCGAIGLALIVRAAGRRDEEASDEGRARWFSASVLALLWVAFDLLGSLAGGRNYRHYFLPLASSLSAVAGLVFWRVFPEGSSPRLGARVFASLLIGALAMNQPADLYKAVRLRKAGDRNDRLREIAARLSSSRRPGETLFTWDYLPEVFLVTGMRSPVRVLDAHYRLDSRAAGEAFERDILPALRAQPPTYVLLGNRPPTVEDPILPDRSPPDASERAFVGWMGENYVVADRAADLVLYRFRAAGPPVPKGARQPIA